MVTLQERGREKKDACQEEKKGEQALKIADLEKQRSLSSTPPDDRIFCSFQCAANLGIADCFPGFQAGAWDYRKSMGRAKIYREVCDLLFLLDIASQYPGAQPVLPGDLPAPGHAFGDCFKISAL